MRRDEAEMLEQAVMSGIGEDFRVRLSYARLRSKAPWRAREIELPSASAVIGRDNSA